MPLVLGGKKEYALSIRDEKNKTKKRSIFTVFETRFVSYDHTREGTLLICSINFRTFVAVHR